MEWPCPGHRRYRGFIRLRLRRRNAKVLLKARWQVPEHRPCFLTAPGKRRTGVSSGTKALRSTWWQGPDRRSCLQLSRIRRVRRVCRDPEAVQEALRQVPDDRRLRFLWSSRCRARARRECRVLGVSGGEFVLADSGVRCKGPPSQVRRSGVLGIAGAIGARELPKPVLSSSSSLASKHRGEAGLFGSASCGLG